MTFYEKDEIRAGIFLVKDGGPAYVKMSVARAPRYGDPPPPPPPDFSAVGEQLDQVRARLEKLRADVRAARGRR